jgi:hypothetical protein
LFHEHKDGNTAEALNPGAQPMPASSSTAVPPPDDMLFPGVETTQSTQQLQMGEDGQSLLLPSIAQKINVSNDQAKLLNYVLQGANGFYQFDRDLAELSDPDDPTATAKLQGQQIDSMNNVLTRLYGAMVKPDFPAPAILQVKQFIEARKSGRSAAQVDAEATARSQQRQEADEQAKQEEARELETQAQRSIQAGLENKIREERAEARSAFQELAADDDLFAQESREEIRRRQEQEAEMIRRQQEAIDAEKSRKGSEIQKELRSRQLAKAAEERLEKAAEERREAQEAQEDDLFARMEQGGQGKKRKSRAFAPTARKQRKSRMMKHVVKLVQEVLMDQLDSDEEAEAEFLSTRKCKRRYQELECSKLSSQRRAPTGFLPNKRAGGSARMRDPMFH